MYDTSPSLNITLIVLYCIALYCIVLYCIVLHCIIYLMLFALDTAPSLNIIP